MKRRIFGVIGLGNFGFHVVRTLAKEGVEVIALDRDPEKVRRVSELVTHAYVADVLDEKALEESGIFTADVVVVSMGENVEASILVTVLLKNRGVKEIVAKALNPLHGEVLKKLGVSRVVFPEMETAERTAKSLLISGVISEFPFAEGYSIFEMEVPKSIVGRSLKELDLRRKYNLNVLAVKREGRVTVNPSAEEVLKEGDIVLVLGKEGDLLKLTD